MQDRPEAGRFIVTDGVFSMSGTLANVPGLVALAKEFGAGLMLDDAHAVGVIGPGGRGSASVFGLEKPRSTSRRARSRRASRASAASSSATRRSSTTSATRRSTHIFSASMPPANVATVLACLDILEAEPERLDRLAEISDYMRDGFRALGFDVWASQTPIIPVVIGEMYTCFRFWKDLLAEGVFTEPGHPAGRPARAGAHADVLHGLALERRARHGPRGLPDGRPAARDHHGRRARWARRGSPR